MSEETHEVIVGSDEAGQRLDRWLAERLGKARNQIQGWAREGRIQVNGRPAKPSLRLDAEARVEWSPPPVQSSDLVPEPGELSVLWRDDHLVVLDKPASLAVHPGAGRSTGTLVHRLLARYPEISGVGGSGRPGIVHRLDLDTTGTIVVARTEQAYLGLVRAFGERRVEKRYVALCYGQIDPADGIIERPLGRHPTRRREIAVRADGRPARTEYRTVASTSGISCVDLSLVTGRTHQIRVHLKSMGHPLVGDPVYGEARWKALPGPIRVPLKRFPRTALHARYLAFEHPVTGEAVAVTAPVPGDLLSLWRALASAAFPEFDKTSAQRAGKSSAG